MKKNLLLVWAALLGLVNYAETANIFSRCTAHMRKNLRTYTAATVSGTGVLGLALYKGQHSVQADTTQETEDYRLYTFPEFKKLYPCLIRHDTRYRLSKDSFLRQDGAIENMSDKEIKRHLIGISWLYEKGVLKAASEEFANTEKRGIGIKTGVRLMLYDMREKLGLDPQTEHIVSLNLVDGLKKCSSSCKSKE